MTEIQSLDRVTFTGADDSVDPMELVKISQVYPYVEWGILFSQSATGAPRFPSLKWLGDFRKAVDRLPGIRLSAHLCGGWVRDFVNRGDYTWRRSYGTDFADIFQRVQINFHGKFILSHHKFLETLSATSSHFILQVDGAMDELVRRLASDRIVIPLFDTSGGAGVLPRGGWPDGWENTYCGFAGGLGPHNIEAQLPVIASHAKGPFWIDMERRIRSEDDTIFELDKVRSVIESVEGMTKSHVSDFKTFWNGEPAEARRCVLEVGSCVLPSNLWYAALTGKRRAAVEVKYEGETFFIDNDDGFNLHGLQAGQGWWKVTKGQGGPDCAHACLPDDSKVVQYLD